RHFDPWGVPAGEGWSTIRTTAIAIGPDGTQWLGLQDGGLIRKSAAGVGEQVAFAPSLAGVAIGDLVTTPDAVWAVTWAGAAKFDGAWTELGGTAESSAAVYDGHAVYLGGAYGLLRCRDACEPVDIGPFGTVTDLATHDGAVLVAGWGGLLEVRGDAVETLEATAVNRVAVSRNGAQWIARRNVASLRGTDVVVTAESGIRALFVDREESVWIGTDATGLRRAFVEDWRLDPANGGMPLFEHEDGTVWVANGCDVGGLTRLGNEGIRPPTASALGCVRALADAGGGAVWVGADNTLWRSDAPDEIAPVVDLPAPVLSVLATTDGAWIGTDGAGAYRLHRRGEQHQLESVDVGDPRVLAIVEGSADEVWFGTHLGVSRHRARDGLSRWTRANGVPAGAIRAVLVEDDGTILLGSYGGGLGVLRGDQVLRLTTEHGLPDNTVSAILDDGEGALWLNGNRGVMRLERGRLEAWIADPSRSVRVRRWGTPEGNGGTQPAGIVRRDGTLLLPTIEGVVALNPHDIYRNDVVPELVVLRAEVDGVRLAVGTTTTVPAGPGRVEIEFTAGTLRRPELVLLEYRQAWPGSGPDEGWRPLGDDRRVVWSGLEPGSYQIELRAANEDGLVSPAVQLRFTLLPAWYERRGVWIALAVLSALLGWLFHRWRTQQVQRQNAALSREVQQRAAAESALRVSEAHYRRVFEGGSDALMVTGPGGMVEHANPAADALVGRPVIGQPAEALFGPPAPGDDVQPVHRDDAELWVSVVEHPFDDDRILVRAVDVTARIQAEHERHQLSKRLATAERMEAVGRIAGGIAHDFNNLLTTVGGTAELLTDSDPPLDEADAGPLLEGLRSCVDRGSKLTRQLLSFARRQHLDPQRTDPAALVLRLRTILRPSLRDDIVFSLELPDDLVGVHVDAAQLELALLNLVLNSQSAISGGGKITLRVRSIEDGEAQATWPELDKTSEAGWVVLEVEDDGHGIAPENLTRVFDPFFTTRDDGTGLGLPSARGFALQSEGGLFLDSEVGRGTTASLLLPRTEAPTNAAVSQAHPRTTGGVGRVIVVDDDDMVREMVVRMLEAAGYETVSYGEPARLLEEFSPSFECDALVTDVLMPGVSGPTLAKRLLEIRPSLPVVFVSGYLRDEGDDALPGPLLSKPFRVHELLETLAQVLASARASAGGLVARG
ncbi:MAG: ATP-binding protein, partial [Myxococcota bacterium]